MKTKGLIVLAGVCFVLAAFGIGDKFGMALMPLGLAFYMASLLIPSER